MAEPSTLPGVTVAVLQTANHSTQEVWCSVEAVAPVVYQVLLALCATVLPQAVAVLAHAVWSLPNRTKPPPVTGGRLRATLQVFRN